MPPATSTSGMRCGGLKGWPSTTRSGWRAQASWNSLTVMVEELVARMASGSAAASRAAKTSRFNASRSGPFSWTNSAASTAPSGVEQKRSRPGEAPGARPIASIAGHCRAMVARNAASASGAGSLAVTSRPRARKQVAQLAPITPVPMMAARRMGASLTRTALPPSPHACQRNPPAAPPPPAQSGQARPSCSRRRARPPRSCPGCAAAPAARRAR